MDGFEIERYGSEDCEMTIKLKFADTGDGDDSYNNKKRLDFYKISPKLAKLLFNSKFQQSNFYTTEIAILKAVQTYVMVCACVV